MSAFTRPIVVSQGGDARILERIPLGAGTDGQFSERDLQRTLFQSPECLPTKDIDPHIGPLIPICMELETGSGPADILYLTPSGQVVLVETKLWRNPEQRRAVVGQILDYAKELTSWTYERLDAKAAVAAKGPPGVLLRSLKSRHPAADQASFVDGVNRSLASGDFLLLVIGDGIRYGTEALVTFLERFGNLRFGLGLIEVAAFRLTSGDTLFLPRILAKTEVMHRTVLLGPSGPITIAEVAQAEDAAAPNRSQREWFESFWKAFLAKLQLGDEWLRDMVPAKSTNQFFSMPPAGNLSWISAYIAQSSKQAGVYLTFSKSFDQAAQIFRELKAARATIAEEVGFDLEWEERDDNKFYISVPTLSFTDLDNDAERQRVITYLADKTTRMVRALEPRMEELARVDG